MENDISIREDADRPQISIETPAGAVYQPLHVGRKVKIYPIQEHELNTIGVHNSQVALWSSIGTSAVVLIVSCIWDEIQNSEPVSGGAVGFMILCGLAALVSGVLAWRANSAKKSQLQAILEETEQSVA